MSKLPFSYADAVKRGGKEDDPTWMRCREDGNGHYNDDDDDPGDNSNGNVNEDNDWSVVVRRQRRRSIKPLTHQLQEEKGRDRSKSITRRHYNQPLTRQHQRQEETQNGRLTSKSTTTQSRNPYKPIPLDVFNNHESTARRFRNYLNTATIAGEPEDNNSLAHIEVRISGFFMAKGDKIFLPYEELDDLPRHSMGNSSVMTVYLYKCSRFLTRTNQRHKISFCSPAQCAEQCFKGDSTKGLMATFQDVDYFVVPIWHGMHWSMAIVCGLSGGQLWANRQYNMPCIFYVNSLDSDLVDRVKRVIISAVETKLRVSVPWYHIKSPRQQNLVDCAFYVMKNIEQLILSQDKLPWNIYPSVKYDSRDIQTMRDQVMEFVMKKAEWRWGDKIADPSFQSSECDSQ